MDCFSIAVAPSLSDALKPCICDREHALTLNVGFCTLFNRPAVVSLVPRILVLVPGTIGYRSLTALLKRQTVLGVEQGFGMVMTGAALVGGLLMANLVLPPKRLL